MWNGVTNSHKMFQNHIYITFKEIINWYTPWKWMLHKWFSYIQKDVFPTNKHNFRHKIVSGWSFVSLLHMGIILNYYDKKIALLVYGTVFHLTIKDVTVTEQFNYSAVTFTNLQNLNMQSYTQNVRVYCIYWT